MFLAAHVGGGQEGPNPQDDQGEDRNRDGGCAQPLTRIWFVVHGLGIPTDLRVWVTALWGALPGP